MKIAAIQHDIVWEEPDQNIKRLSPMLAEAKSQGAELIVLTEMFSWGFSMNTKSIAEEPDGISPSFLIQSAQDLGVWIAGTYPEKTNGNPPAFNQLLLAGPAGQNYKYAKIHPFSYSGEDEHYQAGTQLLNVEIEGGNSEKVSLSAFVCYDLRFGNDFWGLAEKTDLYIIPANWPFVRQNHWETLLQARAIENQAYVVGVNRVGQGNGIEYGGGSAIISPLGEILAQGGDGEEILLAEIQKAEVIKTREKFPFLKDRK